MPGCRQGWLAAWRPALGASPGPGIAHSCAIVCPPGRAALPAAAPSPARTLSGRPSPFLSPAAPPAGDRLPPLVLGAGRYGGGGHALVSTASEAFEDLASELAAPTGFGSAAAFGGAALPGRVRLTPNASRAATASPLGSPPSGGGGSSSGGLSPITEGRPADGEPPAGAGANGHA